LNEKHRDQLWLDAVPVAWWTAIRMEAIRHNMALAPFVMQVLDAGRKALPQRPAPPRDHLVTHTVPVHKIPYAYRLALRQEATHHNMLFRDYLLALLWYGMKARKIPIPVLPTPAP